MNVYYLGPESSFSHAISRQVFSDSSTALVPQKNFRDIFAKVSAESDAVGVVPVENSITSSVHENLDWLFSGQYRILGEGYLPIRLHLLGKPGQSVESVKKIYSHPKAFLQCSAYLDTHPAECIDSSSTSEAAELIVRQSGDSLAVLGGDVLAETHGLEVLAENIGNSSKNFTRFLFFGQPAAEALPGSPSKLSLTFQVPHEPGALVGVLSAFSSLGVNLTRIESRPIPARDWEYLFWVDLEVDPAKYEELLETTKQVTLEYKCLGFYPKGELYRSGPEQ